MSVKILKICLMGLSVLVFSGCAKVVDRPVVVEVPVKCVVPVVHCDFDRGTYTEVIVSMRTCIEDLRETAKVCQ